MTVEICDVSVVSCMKIKKKREEVKSNNRSITKWLSTGRERERPASSS